MDKILGFWAFLGLEGSTGSYCGVEKLGMFWWLYRHFQNYIYTRDFDFDYGFFVFMMVRELDQIQMFSSWGSQMTRIYIII
jgi:hypothetical protein